MASAAPFRIRALVAGVAVLVVSLTGAGSAHGVPTGPRSAPTVASVTARLDQLGRQIENLAEQYNQAKSDARSAERRADRAKHTASAARARYGAARIEFAQIIQQTYEDGSLGAAGALLDSGSGSDYLQRIRTLDLIARHQADVVEQVQASRGLATATGRRAEGAARVARQHLAMITDRRDAAMAKTKQLKSILATLTARQQQQYRARGAATSTQTRKVRSVHAGNAAAQRAVDFALAQVGKPYVFGAEGPGAYDCSGLTMAAWRAGGVTLPHLASSQFDYGTRVSADQLRPGDLVFLYSPIGHVSMYIGHGMLVSAPQAGEDVKVVPFAYFRTDFVGGTRLA